MNNDIKELNAVIGAERGWAGGAKVQWFECGDTMSTAHAERLLRRLPIRVGKLDEREGDIRQVLNDHGVQQAVLRVGGLVEKVRAVQHWAYFDSYIDALLYCTHLQGERYAGIRLEATSSQDEFRVCFGHEGTVMLKDICARSISLRRAARLLRGRYDGWEVEVRIDEASDELQSA